MSTPNIQNLVRLMITLQLYSRRPLHGEGVVREVWALGAVPAQVHGLCRGQATVVVVTTDQEQNRVWK